ncbi:MAG: helix-turn-helix transcriptional regulator [Clostridiaceae bacterium]|jgi:AraC family L-rhamnose operon regulatory protein RhaS|nr:helix-turn-helix transcriptional regulator [Clostridiaceae bacterium]
MDLATIGKKNLTGYRINLRCGREGALDPNKGYREALRIIFVEEGSGIIRIGSRRHVFAAPVVFCFNELDIFRFENCGSCSARTVWFHPDLINISLDFDKIRADDDELTYTELQDIYWLGPFCRRQGGFTGQLNIGPGTAKRISGIFDSIEDQIDLQPDGYWPCRSRSHVIELLFLLSGLQDQPQSTEYICLSRENDEIDEVIQYLHANYFRRITLAQLTKKFHINRTSLGRDFLETTGTTIMTYLMRLRLYIASQMLKDTTLPIAEIYERVGFNDPAHFGRQFRKHYGVSPSEYRRQNNWLIAV